MPPARLPTNHSGGNLWDGSLPEGIVTPIQEAGRIWMGMAGAVRVAVAVPVDIVPLRMTLTFQPAGACAGTVIVIGTSA